ncbi:hypothetical protein [Actinomycetospora flava]|uniref:Uncharacterized protein n=1 Tax=Actinomycetospora flava TaxID=3129232 RepID=A0ABU8MAR9_9PSEU
MRVCSGGRRDRAAAEPELTRQMMLGWIAATGPIRHESQLLADLRPLLREGQERGEVADAALACPDAAAVRALLRRAPRRRSRAPSSTSRGTRGCTRYPLINDSDPGHVLGSVP